MSPSPDRAAFAAGIPAATAGIGFAVTAFAVYSLMDTLIKWLSGGYPLGQIVFFLTAMTYVPVGIMVAREGGVGALATRRLPLHLLRAGIGSGGALCSFFAYSRMPLADAYAIAFSAPLFITALSVPLLREPVGWRRWTAVAVGFVGVLIMLRPGAGAIGPGTAAALGGTVAYALGVIALRRLSGTETTAAIMFYGNTVGFLTSGVLVSLGTGTVPGLTGFVAPSAGDLAGLLAIGVAAGCGQVCSITAFKLAPAAVVAPFQYTQMLWAVFYGFLIWGDVPDGWMLAGVPIVVASGLYILHRETVLRRSPPATAASGPGFGDPLPVADAKRWADMAPPHP